MSQVIEVATLVSAELNVRLVVACPYCKRKNVVSEKLPVNYICDPNNIMNVEMDSVKCYYCNRISFLDEEGQDSYRLNEDEPITDDELVNSVKGKPVT